MSKRERPLILSIDEIAKRASDVVSDVDELIAQIKLMVEEQSNNG